MISFPLLSSLARTSVRRFPVSWGAVAVLALGSGCRQTAPKPSQLAAALEVALFPLGFASRLPRLGRVHVHGVSKMSATLESPPVDKDGKRIEADDGIEAITTETDVWSDDTGNFRAVEINDRDGGREIVRYDHELAVALRYGKLIKRTAIEPEPTNLLAEAVGGPFAFFDLVRAGAAVDDLGEEVGPGGRKVHSYQLAVEPKKQYFKLIEDAKGTRAWRKTMVLEALDGKIKVDVATRVPLEANLRASYRMTRPTSADETKEGQGVPMRGTYEVKLSVAEIGTSPVVAPPEADELPQRQRTVQEEKTLLGGLASRAPLRPEKPEGPIIGPKGKVKR